MWKILIGFGFFLTLNLLCEGNNVSTEKSESIRSRIVGGMESKGDYIHVGSVALRHLVDGSYFCGGNIIAPNWVLTTASCVDEIYRKGLTGRSKSTRHFGYALLVHAGNKVLGPVSEGNQVREVHRIILHPEWETVHAKSVAGDIALLKVEPCFEYNKDVESWTLTPAEIFYGQACEVAGWGQTERNVSEPTEGRKLMFTELKYINDSDCVRWRQAEVSPGTICFASQESNKGLCYGDEGYGIGCFVNNNFTLVGLVSSINQGCHDENGLAVFTDLKRFIPWIETTMKKEGTECYTDTGYLKISSAGSQKLSYLFLVPIFSFIFQRL